MAQKATSYSGRERKAARAVERRVRYDDDPWTCSHCGGIYHVDEPQPERSHPDVCLHCCDTERAEAHARAVSKLALDAMFKAAGR